MNVKAFKAYQSTNVTTAKPEKVLLMLYEGCIKFLRVAKVRMQEKKIAEKGKNLSKAIAIIAELINTLDHEVGGQLSADLENLYMFIMDKLIEANINNKVEDIEVAEKLLNTLYEAWRDVVSNPRPDGVPSPTLQPELYETYLKSIKNQQSIEEANNKNLKNEKSSAAAVNLSAEVKPAVSSMNSLSKK
ncbi:flagellar export chaperone FliS [Pigmentibacter sp. JX0631]|uniref:flagellar export chaperone FliS n=1 Tax=Pigmentibacter sp. JX0631 TaxID=2976982 RepID=UPI002468D56D|nr:flagellar export chaperone FliS [Pigmentibacter sp. JX0631]WGL60381.1 flagellar export chaperone FliS [Pigmentibacter sp. JX0631]